MQLVLISGPPDGPQAAVADALCERFDRMLHIEIDVLESFLRMGSVTSRANEAAALAQRRLFIESACGMANRFLAAGYGVVISDVVLPNALALYVAALPVGPHTSHFVVLRPPFPSDAETHGFAERETLDVHRRLAEWSAVAALETSDLTPDVIADRVMALAGQGKILLSTGRQSP